MQSRVDTSKIGDGGVLRAEKIGNAVLRDLRVTLAMLRRVGRFPPRARGIIHIARTNLNDDSLVAPSAVREVSVPCPALKSIRGDCVERHETHVGGVPILLHV